MGYFYSFSNGTIICAVFHNILIMIYNYFICIKIHSASLQFSQRRMNKIYAFTHCFLFLWLAVTLKNENYLKSSVNNSNVLYIIYTYNCNKEASSCVPSFKQEFLFGMNIIYIKFTDVLPSLQGSFKLCCSSLLISL